MVVLFNIVQGGPGVPPMLVPQHAGAAPAPGQLGIQIFLVPGVVPPVQAQQINGYMRFVRKIYDIAIFLLSAVKDIIEDPHATSDFLKVFENVTKLCEEKFRVLKARRLVNAFKGFTDINSLRSFATKLYSLLSGEALFREQFENSPNWFRFSSTTAFLCSDFCKTLEWLHTIRVLSTEWIQWLEETHLAKCFLNLSRISTIGTIAGSILSGINNYKIIQKYSVQRDDTPERVRQFKLLSAKIDLANDVFRVACIALSAIPDPTGKLSTIFVGSVSAISSLAKFFIREYTQKARDEEHSRIEATKASALQLVTHELLLASLTRGDARTSNEAIQLINGIMRDIANRPRTIQLMGAIPLARELLTRARAAALVPPPPGQPPHDPLAALQLDWARNHLALPMPPIG